MNYEELLTKYMNQSTLEILSNSKLFDSLQFIESTFKKLMFAKIEYEAINNLEKMLKEDNEKWRKELFETKSASNYNILKIDYLSLDLDYEIVKEKLVFSFFHYLHSLFDNSAHIVNKCLLANEQKPLDAVSLRNIIEALNKYQKDEFIDVYNHLKSTSENSIYQYIEDFNNVNKHQYSMKISSTIYLYDGEIESLIPEFVKKAHKHNEVDLNEVLLKSLDFSIVYLDALLEKVFSFINSNTLDFAKDRFHKVTNEIQKSKSNDVKVEGATTFLNTDEELNLGDVIGVLLVSDDGARYDLRNITAEHIFIRDSTNTVKGILSITQPLKINKKFELFEYRKYRVTKLGDVSKEMIIDFFSKPKHIKGNFNNDIITLLD